MAQDLKAYNVVATADVNPDVVDRLGCTEFTAYDADDVDSVLAEKDAAIAELKNEINRKEGVGQRWFERCMEARTENVSLKRAMWLARAWRAESVMEYLTMKCKYFEKSFSIDVPKCDVDLLAKWAKIIPKCRAKAEEYK